MFEYSDSYKIQKEIIKDSVRSKLNLEVHQFDSAKYNQALYLLKKHSQLIESKNYGNKLSPTGKKMLLNFIKEPNKFPISIQHSNGRTTYLIYLDGYYSVNGESIANLKSLELESLLKNNDIKLRPLGFPYKNLNKDQVRSLMFIQAKIRND